MLTVLHKWKPWELQLKAPQGPKQVSGVSCSVGAGMILLLRQAVLCSVHIHCFSSLSTLKPPSSLLHGAPQLGGQQLCARQLQLSPLLLLAGTESRAGLTKLPWSSQTSDLHAFKGCCCPARPSGVPGCGREAFLPLS